MKWMQLHDIPRLASDAGGGLGEILAIGTVSVIAGLVYWVIRQDKKLDKKDEYQQSNDEKTLIAINAMLTLLDAVKSYLPDMKGDIKEEISSKHALTREQLKGVEKSLEAAREEVTRNLKGNG
jgi:hypothetical protein